MHSYSNSSLGSFIEQFTTQIIHVKQSLWNWQYHLRPSCTHQRLIQNRNTWKRHKNMKKVHCYWSTRLAGRLTRSGKLKASKHCSLLHNRSPWRVDGEQTLLSITHSSSWRADYSPWRIATGFCREVRFFTPKTQFSSNPIPNLIGNSSYDHSTI